MKKARLMLTAIAILAMAGGALAFRTSRAAMIIFKKNPQGTACTRLPGFYDINPAAPPVTGVYATLTTNTTQVPTAVCSLTLRITVEE